MFSFLGRLTLFRWEVKYILGYTFSLNFLYGEPERESTNGHYYLVFTSFSVLLKD